MTRPVNLHMYVVVSDISCGLLGDIGLKGAGKRLIFIRRFRYLANDFLSYGWTSYLSIVFMSVYLVRHNLTVAYFCQAQSINAEIY